jgi:microcystin degradation protein MlrC
MTDAHMTVKIGTDTSELARVARIIAKHLNALADELRPQWITTDEDLDAETAAAIRARYSGKTDQP